jgi:cyclic pyranopterin monophosphate synthase
MARARLTHLDAKHRPTMVDVGEKPITLRVALAEARMRLPRSVLTELRRTGHRTRKGPVFDTAIIAGVMAAKRTHELIPFCHPLTLDHCKALSHDIEITSVRLLEKSGGKRDFRRASTRSRRAT